MNAALSTVVLTGATSGIGRATAERLAPRVDHLLLHGPEPAQEVRSFLGELEASETRIDYLTGDFQDLAQVVRLAAEIADRTDVVDVLVNNAGRPGAPRRTITGDGHEATLQVNYLAPVLLTSRLLGGGSGTQVERVVNVASATHFSAELRLDDLELERHPYEPSAAYARSKLALVTYSCWLAGRAGATEVVSMHPGVIATELLHAMFSVGGASPESAAANVIEVMVRRDDSGSYYDERHPIPPHPAAMDPVTQGGLHDVTESWLAPFLQG